MFPNLYYKQAEVNMSEQKNESIQIEQLKNDLEKAAITLKLLPRNHMDKPMGMRSAWPDFAQNQIRMASERQIVLQPSAKEIDHLEKFLNHMMELTESERIIVWEFVFSSPFFRQSV